MEQQLAVYDVVSACVTIELLRASGDAIETATKPKSVEPAPAPADADAAVRKYLEEDDYVIVSHTK